MPALTTRRELKRLLAIKKLMDKNKRKKDSGDNSKEVVSKNLPTFDYNENLMDFMQFTELLSVER